MGLIDDLTGKASDMINGASGGMGGVVNSVLGATGLEQEAINMIDSKLGAGKFEELKGMLADGKITKEEIAQMATEAGVPATMVEMAIKFLG